jgi:hypothetical protein
MLTDMETLRPDMILVQRLDRFGTADSNELGYFVTLLKKQGVRLITAREGLANAVGVTGVREGPGQQFLQRHSQLGEAGPHVPQAGIVAQPGKLLQRQGPDVGRVTEFLHPVVRLGLLRAAGEHVDDRHPPSGPAHPHHLGQHGLRVEEVVEAVAGDDRRETGHPVQVPNVIVLPSSRPSSFCK